MQDDPNISNAQLPLFQMMEGLRSPPSEPCSAYAESAQTCCAVQGSSRHWLMDHMMGREVLISQLRLNAPEQTPPWYVIRAPGLDQQLEPLIDVLGWRDAPQPATIAQDLTVSFRLFGLFLNLECRALKALMTQPKRGTTT